MTGHLRSHLTHMAVGGIGLLAILVMFGVRFPQALTWALLLACPLGMMGMMWLMGREGHGRGDAPGDRDPALHVPADIVRTHEVVPESDSREVPNQRGHRG